MHRREAYQGLVDQVGAGERPAIGVMVEDFGGNGEHNGFDSTQSTLSISWVTQAARIDRRIQSARVAASQVDIQQQIKALDLSAQTARLFIQVLVEEQRLALAHQAAQQARNTVAALERRVDVGKSPEFERLQSEVELAQRELEAEDLQHVLTSTRYQLSAQWGGKRNGFRLVGELFKVPAIGSVDQQFDQLKQNPSIALLATQQRIAESNIELARIEAKPQWQFSVGGTVGFPVLVLLLDMPATLGRDFSFAVQSVGMTSASIYILCRGQEIEWPMLRAALAGAMVVSKIGRRPTLLIVSVLCVGQFIWTLIHERANLTAWNISSALLGVVLFLLVFQEMYAQGYRMARRQRRNPLSA